MASHQAMRLVGRRAGGIEHGGVDDLRVEVGVPGRRPAAGQQGRRAGGRRRRGTSTTQACSAPWVARVATDMTRMAPVATWVSVSIATALARASAAPRAASSSAPW